MCGSFARKCREKKVGPRFSHFFGNLDTSCNNTNTRLRIPPYRDDKKTVCFGAPLAGAYLIIQGRELKLHLLPNCASLRGDRACVRVYRESSVDFSSSSPEMRMFFSRPREI